MRQRNCTGGPLVFPTLAPPLEVEANGVIDLPDDLGVLPGFELVDPAEQPPDPPVEPVAAESTPDKPKTKRSTAAARTDAGEA